jgi:hypothetical protein
LQFIIDVVVGPLTLLYALIACGVLDNVALFLEETQAQCISDEAFDRIFASCMDVTFKEVDEQFIPYSDLTVAQGQIRCVQSEQNAELLKSVDFDLGWLILEHSSSTLGFGSEFRMVAELRPLIGQHPHFARLENLLTEVMPYVFEREPTPKERSDEVDATLARGNHKFAQTERVRVGELARDVIHGFTTPSCSRWFE